MILLVPASPEVPDMHLPRLWPGLIMVLVLTIAYSYVEPVISRDKTYIEGIQRLPPAAAGQDHSDYLKLRPLLEIAPAHGDWDFDRVLMANFIHGNRVHLLLNLIAVFAGARICATFLPFFWTVIIFVLGGSLGLWISVLMPTQYSPYIPHVGASAGIFALMGTYYVFNFRYRTRYFFWFPTKYGKLALPTSWFFFFDVVLLELVLSVGQLFPSPLDSIDHVSHVMGFFFGAVFALFLRILYRWPKFIHTRGELLFWKTLRMPPNPDPVLSPMQTWIKCLEVNPYNDRIKFRLYGLITNFLDRVRDEHLEVAFRFARPAFCRRDARFMADLIKALLRGGRRVPPLWLRNTPYDVIIRIAKHIVTEPDEQALLYQFISAYQASLPREVAVHHKLELLLSKIGGLTPPVPSPSWNDPGGTPRNATGGNTPPPGTARSPRETAKKGY